MMKTVIKLAMLFLIINFNAGCSSDDNEGINNPVNDPVNDYTTVRFEENFSVNENEGARKVIIEFDQPAVADGEIELRLHLQEGLNIQTQPEAVEGIITLSIEKGDEDASFSLLPADDEIIKGMKNLSVTFGNMSAGFRKAHNNGLSIIVVDDELKGKAKSYSGPNYILEYIYRDDGKIAETNLTADWWIENNIYQYTASGNIQKIISDSGFNKSYYWERGKLVRSEESSDEMIYYYSLYGYDDAGYISEKTDFSYDPTLEDYVPSYHYRYTYNAEGNLYRRLGYTNDAETGEYRLVSTETFDDYLDKPNPLPLNDIVPGITAQKNLPGTYRLQTTHNRLYNYNYTFDPEGKMIRSIMNDQVITIEYY